MLIMFMFLDYFSNLLIFLCRMTFLCRASIPMLVSQATPKSSVLTACYVTNSTINNSKTSLYPIDEKLVLQTPPAAASGPPARAKGQFVRKHGTTTKFVNESERNLDYCFKKVRQYEFENFLCTLLLPEEARRGAIAIRAFNIEIAQVLITAENFIFHISFQCNDQYEQTKAKLWSISAIRLIKSW